MEIEPTESFLRLDENLVTENPTNENLTNDDLISEPLEPKKEVNNVSSSNSDGFDFCFNDICLYCHTVITDDETIRSHRASCSERPPSREGSECSLKMDLDQEDLRKMRADVDNLTIHHLDQRTYNAIKFEEAYQKLARNEKELEETNRKLQDVRTELELTKSKHLKMELTQKRDETEWSNSINRLKRQMLELQTSLNDKIDERINSRQKVNEMSKINEKPSTSKLEKEDGMTSDEDLIDVFEAEKEEVIEKQIDTADYLNHANEAVALPEPNDLDKDEVTLLEELKKRNLLKIIHAKLYPVEEKDSKYNVSFMGKIIYKKATITVYHYRNISQPDDDMDLELHPYQNGAVAMLIYEKKKPNNDVQVKAFEVPPTISKEAVAKWYDRYKSRLISDQNEFVSSEFIRDQTEWSLSMAINAFSEEEFLELDSEGMLLHFAIKNTKPN